LEWSNADDGQLRFAVVNRQVFYLRQRDDKSMSFWAEDVGGRRLWEVDVPYATSCEEEASVAYYPAEVRKLWGRIVEMDRHRIGDRIRQSLQALTAA